MLELIPINIDVFIKKKGLKHSGIVPGSTSNIKITFSLLTRLIIVHIQLFKIQI